MKMLLAKRPLEELGDDRPELVGPEDREEWDIDKAAEEAVERAFQKRADRKKQKGDDTCDGV